MPFKITDALPKCCARSIDHHGPGMRLSKFYARHLLACHLLLPLVGLAKRARFLWLRLCRLLWWWSAWRRRRRWCRPTIARTFTWVSWRIGWGRSPWCTRYTCITPLKAGNVIVSPYRLPRVAPTNPQHCIILTTLLTFSRTLRGGVPSGSLCVYSEGVCVRKPPSRGDQLERLDHSVHIYTSLVRHRPPP